MWYRIDLCACELHKSAPLKFRQGEIRKSVFKIIIIKKKNFCEPVHIGGKTLTSKSSKGGDQCCACSTNPVPSALPVDRCHVLVKGASLLNE